MKTHVPPNSTSPPARKETYRTVHEVLEESALVLEACASGLSRLSEKAQLGQRDRLMLDALSQRRRQAAEALHAVVTSTPRHGENTWIQYAPLFGSCPRLEERILTASSGAAAYEVVCAADREVGEFLDTMSDASPASKELIEQVSAVFSRVQRESAAVVQGARDM